MYMHRFLKSEAQSQSEGHMTSASKEKNNKNLT